MKPFKKTEAAGLIIIIFIILTITLANMKVALRRSRDSQRRQDLGSLSAALHSFYRNYGFFPPSENGEIKACKGDNFDSVINAMSESGKFDRTIFFEGLETCDFGRDELKDHLNNNAYLAKIPQDPKASEGLTYLYISNTQRFQLYSALEGELPEEGYDSGIAKRSLSCGNKICSFGKSFAETPLDRSIEDYEDELLQKEKSGKP